MRRLSVEGQLVTKSKTQYFGRELYIRCMYKDDDKSECFGMYDVPSIIGTFQHNAYQAYVSGEIKVGQIKEKWEQELEIFSSRLSEHIREQGLGKIIKIIVVNNRTDEDDEVYALMKEAFDAKYMNPLA